MRRTVKYLKAVDKLNELKPGSARVGIVSHEAAYGTLEGEGFFWDAESAEWKEGTPPSTSMFKDNEGDPTGFIRVRIMAHPNEIEWASNQLKIEGARLVERSVEYPNRRGVGVRVYLTFVRGE